MLIHHKKGDFKIEILIQRNLKLNSKKELKAIIKKA